MNKILDGRGEHANMIFEMSSALETAFVDLLKTKVLEYETLLKNKLETAKANCINEHDQIKLEN